MKVAYEVKIAVLPGMLYHDKLIYIGSCIAKYIHHVCRVIAAPAISKSSLVTFSRYIAQEFRREGITAVTC